MGDERGDGGLAEERAGDRVEEDDVGRGGGDGEDVGRERGGGHRGDGVRRRAGAGEPGSAGAGATHRKYHLFMPPFAHAPRPLPAMPRARTWLSATAICLTERVPPTGKETPRTAWTEWSAATVPALSPAQSVSETGSNASAVAGWPCVVMGSVARYMVDPVQHSASRDLPSLASIHAEQPRRPLPGLPGPSSTPPACRADPICSQSGTHALHRCCPSRPTSLPRPNHTALSRPNGTRRNSPSTWPHPSRSCPRPHHSQSRPPSTETTPSPTHLARPRHSRPQRKHPRSGACIPHECPSPRLPFAHQDPSREHPRPHPPSRANSTAHPRLHAHLLFIAVFRPSTPSSAMPDPTLIIKVRPILQIRLWSPPSSPPWRLRSSYPLPFRPVSPLPL